MHMYELHDSELERIVWKLMIHRWKLTFFATWKLRKMLPRLRQAFFVFSMFWMSYTATQIDGGEKFSCTSSVCVRRWARTQCGKLLFREIYVFLLWNIWFSTQPPPESTSSLVVCITCICVFRSESHSDVKNVPEQNWTLTWHSELAEAHTKEQLWTILTCVDEPRRLDDDIQFLSPKTRKQNSISIPLTEGIWHFYTPILWSSVKKNQITYANLIQT